MLLQTPETLLSWVRPHVEKAGYEGVEDEYLTKAIELMQERVTVIQDFVEMAPYFFENPSSYDAKMSKKRWKEDTGELMSSLQNKFEALSSWNTESIKSVFEAYLEERELGTGKVLAPLRLALTGVAGGPGVFDIAALIGKELTMERMQSAVKTLG